MWFLIPKKIPIRLIQLFLTLVFLKLKIFSYSFKDQFQKEKRFNYKLSVINQDLSAFFLNTIYTLIKIIGKLFIKRFLALAKKKPYNKTSNYGIYYSQSREKSELIPIGKVRSNFVGTEFLIYDNGKNHKEALVPVEERKVLAGIVYVSN